MHTLINPARSNEGGFVVSAELVLIATIAVLAVIVGLSGITSGPTQTREEVGSTIRIMPQSYDFGRLCSHHSFSDGEYVLS